MLTIARHLAARPTAVGVTTDAVGVVNLWGNQYRLFPEDLLSVEYEDER